jgi:hypothetical protein
MTARARTLAGWAFVAIAATAATGCLRGRPEINVPVQADAAAQYAYALRDRDTRRIGIILDRKKYERARAVVIETFRKVKEFFPDDRTSTPLAELDVIMMECGFDAEGHRVEMSERRAKRAMDRAIERLTALSEAYPEHQYVQAMSMYLRGMCHKRKGEYAPAQEYFKAVRDGYRASDDPIIKELAGRADYFYNKTYVEE